MVILNWNGLGDTLDCLHSLKQLRYENFSVVVVDNGSAPSEADQIEGSGLAGTVLRGPGNLGYAAGCNVGIRHAIGQNADYMWLLNNDTIIDPDCLDALVTAGEDDDRIGLLSPVVYEYVSPHAIQFAGTVVAADGCADPDRDGVSTFGGDNCPSVSNVGQVEPDPDFARPSGRSCE